MMMTHKQEERLARVKAEETFDKAFQLVYEWIKKGTVDLHEANFLVRAVTGHERP